MPISWGGKLRRFGARFIRLLFGHRSEESGSRDRRTPAGDRSLVKGRAYRRRTCSRKEKLLGSEAIRNQSNSAFAATVAVDELVGLGFDNYLRRREQVERATISDVRTLPRNISGLLRASKSSCDRLRRRPRIKQKSSILTMAEVQTSTQSGEMSQRFIEFVMMQAQQASLFLGRIPSPQSGKTEVLLEPAKLFIDHLEMIREKTRGI